MSLSRRKFLSALSLSGAALGLAGCLPRTASSERPVVNAIPVAARSETPVPVEPFDGSMDYKAIYGPVHDEQFQIRGVDLRRINKAFLRADVFYETNEAPGTIVVDPRAHYLYHIQGGGRARRYGVGVGRQGFSWSGDATINFKREWPDWYPPKEMFQRQPELKRVMSQLQSGIGMHGGPRNPLGARALYLWQGNKDTLYRIHGTVEPWTIGKSVSSGCIRMINQDVIDLYNNVEVGARVVVLGTSRPSYAALDGGATDDADDVARHAAQAAYRG